MSEQLHLCANLQSSAKIVKPLRWWMIVLVGLLGFMVYSNSLRNGFAFDDVAIVQENPHVQQLNWTGIWTDNYWPAKEGVMPDALYRPITLWSYLANQATTPDFAWAFHLVNVVLHALVTMLVAMLAWRLFGSRAVAVVAGVLFAVHPLHTEVVANTVGRAELLAALWTLLAFLVYLPRRPLMEETGPDRRGWWHGWLVAACFLVAILSKETPAAFVPAVVLLDGWRWMRWPKENRGSWWKWANNRMWRYYLPLGVATGIYLALRIPASGLTADIRHIHPMVNELVRATMAQRIVTPFMLLAKYLSLMVWPVHLSADYSAPSLMPTANIFAPLPLTGALVCVLTVLASVRLWRRRPQMALLAFLFVTSYFLVANIVRIGTIFGERLFYWPSVFVLMLAAWGLVWAWEQVVRRRSYLLAGTGVALALAAVAGMMRVTWVRNTDWADNTTLAIATGRDNPRSGKACTWAGAELLAVEGRKDITEIGVSLLKRGAELSPDYMTPCWDLAKFYGRQGDLADSAIWMARAARLDPGSALSHGAAEGVKADFKKNDPGTYMPALEAYRAAHAEDPSIYYALALAYHALGKLDLAHASARQALDLANNKGATGFKQFHEAGAELAAIKIDQGQIEAGIEEYRTYMRNLDNSAQAHCTFAEALLGLDPAKYHDAYKEADVNLMIAKLLDPKNPSIPTLRDKLTGLKLAEARGSGSPEGQLTDVKPLKDDAVRVPGGARR